MSSGLRVSPVCQPIVPRMPEIDLINVITIEFLNFLIDLTFVFLVCLFFKDNVRMLFRTGKGIRSVQPHSVPENVVQ